MKNDQLHQTIVALEKQSKKSKVQIWKRIADDLNKPTRQRREVNVTKIALNTQKGDSVVVPGKVLGTGSIDHPVTVVAYSISERAKDKITQAGGSVRTLAEELEKNAKGSKLKILG